MIFQEKNKVKLVEKLAKNLSINQLNFISKITQVQSARQRLNKIKSISHLLTTEEKKQKKRTKRKRVKKQVSLSPNSYKNCDCLQKLNQIADSQSNNVCYLIRKKETLVQDRERLKYYSNNAIESRQAYFIEEIERKNLQIIYLQQKLQEKRKRNQTSLRKLSKEISKAKLEKQSLKLRNQNKK